jgi:hypothetical protein
MVQHPLQIHNYARVIRFHLPSSIVQSWLTWLNSTFSQHGIHTRLFAVAFPHYLPVIALGGESLEVLQQTDDMLPVSSAAADVDFVIMDALMSFVSEHDYLAAAPQLNALLNVRVPHAANSMPLELPSY